MHVALIEIRRLWETRDLLFEMVGRESQKRLRGTRLGIAWRILQPLFTIALLTMVFTRLLPVRLAVDSGYGSYAIYLCAGLLPWMAIEDVSKSACQYYLGQADMVRSFAHSRLLFVVAPVIVSWATLLLSFAILLVVALCVGQSFSLALLWLLPLCAALGLLLIGLGLVFAIVNTALRDLEPLLDSILPLVFWITPIVYHPDVLGERFQPLVSHNPLMHIMACFRSVILEGRAPAAFSLAVFAGAVALALLSGLWLFGRNAGTLADRV